MCLPSQSDFIVFWPLDEHLRSMISGHSAACMLTQLRKPETSRFFFCDGVQAEQFIAWGAANRMTKKCRSLQAGVALGLARMVGVRFPSWGPQFQTLAASIIILNLCIGPPLFRAAIVSIGEARLPGAVKVDHSSPAVTARHSERLHDRSQRSQNGRDDTESRLQSSQGV